MPREKIPYHSPLSFDELCRLEDRDIWEQLPGENLAWFSTFNQFRLVGPERNLTRFYRNYRIARGTEQKNTVAMKLPSRWCEISAGWFWKNRAEAWDAAMRDMQELAAQEVLQTGLALSHERLRKLSLMANKLETILLDDDRPKYINADLLEQYRGVLDDIAKEKGERNKETKILGMQTGTVIIQTSWGRGGSATDAWEAKKIDPSIVVEAEKDGEHAER